MNISYRIIMHACDSNLLAQQYLYVISVAFITTYERHSMADTTLLSNSNILLTQLHFLIDFDITYLSKLINYWWT